MVVTTDKSSLHQINNYRDLMKAGVGCPSTKCPLLGNEFRHVMRMTNGPYLSLFGQAPQSTKIRCFASDLTVSQEAVGCSSRPYLCEMGDGKCFNNSLGASTKGMFTHYSKAAIRLVSTAVMLCTTSEQSLKKAMLNGASRELHTAIICFPQIAGSLKILTEQSNIKWCETNLSLT